MTRRRRTPDPLVARAASRTITGALVAGWFTEAAGGRELSVPSVESCERLARSLAGLAGDLGRTGEPQADFLGKARKPLITAGHALPRVAADIDQLLISGPRSKLPAAYRDQLRELVDTMQATERAIEKLMRQAADAENAQGGGHPDWPSLARIVWGAAATAWRSTNERPPRGKRPDDPACTFVCLALTGMGMTISGAAVSEALRKRETRERGGAEHSTKKRPAHKGN